MSIDAVRRAFALAAGDQLRLDHAGMTYKGPQQVLSVTGWYADGTPFATVTEPFDGPPIVRASKAARDLIEAHKPMPGTNPGITEPAPIAAIRSTVTMSQKGSGLARLVGGLRDFDSKADALATRLEQAMVRMETALPTTEAIVGNVEKGAADLEAVNSQYSNGGPTGASPAPSSS